MCYIYIELDVEGLMQCAREAETSCDRPATPIPAWTSDTQVYNSITPMYFVVQNYQNFSLLLVLPQVIYPAKLLSYYIAII